MNYLLQNIETKSKTIKEIKGTYEMLTAKLINWFESFVVMLPNIIIAILIVILFHLIAKIIRRLLEKTMYRFFEHTAINKLIVSVLVIGVRVIGLFVALSILQLDKTVTSLLAGIGVVGLGLGLAFQDAASNFISGLVLAAGSPIKVGDIIQSKDDMGVVKTIGIRTTTLTTPQGQDIVIPNSQVIQSSFTHYTVYKHRRIDLQVGISYGEDLEKVEQITLQAIRKIPYLLKDKNVNFYYEEFGDSSINFVIQYWIRFEKIADFYQARHDGVKNIKQAYNENNITIPFPIRTLDFGIKGGEKLDTMLKGEKLL